ncbi:hypothetical protein GQ54DRAFT_325418 [Martensiomyces pterosporus]|nr:hypothetical protein GQ54DRAFT_325418 [Martensiomyces pterosporus]
MNPRDVIDIVGLSGYTLSDSYTTLTPPYPHYLFNQVASYVIGGVFILLLLWLIITSYRARSTSFLMGMLAASSLSASFFIRGTYGYGGNTDYKLYMALNILYTGGANLLASTALYMAGNWVHVADNGVRRAAFVPWFLCLVCFFAANALEVVGWVDLFSSDGNDTRYKGLVLHIAAVSTTLGMCLIGFFLVFVKMCITARLRIKADVFILLASLVLVAVWAGFSIAQLRLPVDSSANTSQTLWGLFSTLPLALVIIVWAALNAPRRFRFDDFFGDRKPEWSRPIVFVVNPA